MSGPQLRRQEPMPDPQRGRQEPGAGPGGRNYPVSDITASRVPFDSKVTNRMTVKTEDPFIGTRIITEKGRYDILQLIGEGGMGLVYKGVARPRDADDTFPGQDVAVKFLREIIATTQDSQRARFYNETYALQNLIHPNIVRLLDYGITAETAHMFMVMEYLDGQNLQDELSSGNLLEWSRAAKILDQTLEALKYAHEQRPPIYNRDVKPANIQVLKDDLAKLMDFGTVKVDDPTFLTLTETGMFVGSPNYLPPEVLVPDRFKEVEESRLPIAREIYSAGVLLYQLLTGTLPFKSDDLLSLQYKIVHRLDLVPPSECKPVLGIPRKLDEIAMRAMAGHPYERFQSIADLQYALRNVHWNGRPQTFLEKLWDKFCARWDLKSIRSSVVRISVLLAVVAGSFLAVRYPEQTGSFLTNTHRGISSFYNNHIRPSIANAPKLAVPERQYTVSITSNVAGAAVYQKTAGKLDSLGTVPFTYNFSGAAQHVLLVKYGRELQPVTVSPTNTNVTVHFSEPVPAKGKGSSKALPVL